jgi:aspartate-semialdehyde dehydrogenase
MATEESTYRVAILGATGLVGQRLIQHLAEHPWFRIERVCASDRSAGLPYGEVAPWYLASPCPDSVAGMTVTTIEPDPSIHLAFSALDATVAEEAEPAWAAAGVLVFSNAHCHRMAADVPLVIPEVNPDHLELLEVQRAGRGFPAGGGIVTNANCSATFLAMALAPLHRSFGVKRASVVTMQAISGAGYRGVASMEILGNVVPHIAGEEEKLECETQKILGEWDGQAVSPARFPVSAQVNRVPVLDGHTEALSVELEGDPGLDEVRDALRAFRGPPQELDLPTAPRQPIIVLDGPDRPQPALDLEVEGGMATVVGNIRSCPVLGYKMTILGHNTIRGAGVGSVLNAELAVERGWLGAV